MTNREWMESLTDTQLANFLTDGLILQSARIELKEYGMFVASVRTVSQRYTSSHLGIEKWFNQEQEFEVIT